MALLSSPLALIQLVPPVTRTFIAVTVASSATYGWCWWKGLAVEAAYYLTLIPGSCIFTPWTFLTSAAVEITIFGFIASLIFVPAGLKYLERLWGSIELLKFIVVTVVASNIIAFGLNWIEYMATSNAPLFLQMRYHGQTSLQIGLLVAFTQLIPEHQVSIMGVISVRVKTLPMAYLTLSTVLCLVGFQNPWILIQFGWFVSWIYLRFYKKTVVDSLNRVTYGDRSDTFALVSWFPPFMHYPLTILGNTIYSIATRLHLIPGSDNDRDIETGGYLPVPGGARAEAERRRAMALKALDQRMANTSSPVGSSSSNPSSSRAPQLPSLAKSDSNSSTQSGSANGVSNGRKSAVELDISESTKA